MPRASLFPTAERRHGGLSREAEHALARRIREEGDESARAELIVANLALCVHVAKPYQGRGLDLDDLVGYATVGLTRAADAFDERRGNRFSTMATAFIRNELSRAIEAHAELIRTPAWTQTLRRKRSAAALAGLPDPASEAQRRLLARADRARSVARESEIGADGQPGGGFALARMVAGGDTDTDDSPPAVVLERADERRAVWRRLGELDGRWRRAVVLRFGLDGGPPRTLREVAAELGISRERVRQIEEVAMGRLRELCRRDEADGRKEVRA